MWKLPLMRSMPMRVAGVAIPLLLAALAGCENDLPTVTGDEGFPSELVPATYQFVVPAEEFLVTDTVFEGFSTNLNYLLVANRFDGALSANALARFTNLPDSVTYVVGGTPRTEPIRTYGRSRISAAVDSASSTSNQQVALELRAITQDWDTTAVSWENAVNRPENRVAWTTPGGTTAPEPLAATVYVPADTATNDSVHFSVDSITVGRLARGELYGVLVRGLSSGTRAELGPFVLDLAMRPTGRDTVITERLTSSKQTFVLTPSPPAGTEALRVGGLVGARSVVRIDLDRMVNTCGPTRVGTDCRDVPLTQVTLDAVSLLLDPLPVPSGFRPLVNTPLTVRRILEPELGRRAPLGEVVSTQSIEPALFAAGGQRPIAIALFGPVAQAIVAGTDTLDLALTANIGGNDFGTAWFSRNPRLRFIYTVPQRPRLP